MKFLELLAIDEKQITEKICLIGTSVWLAIVNGSDVSC